MMFPLSSYHAGNGPRSQHALFLVLNIVLELVLLFSVCYAFYFVLFINSYFEAKDNFLHPRPILFIWFYYIILYSPQFSSVPRNNNIVCTR